MDAETFGSFLWIMTLVAALVFIALYFVKAGYGMFVVQLGGFLSIINWHGC